MAYAFSRIAPALVSLYLFFGSVPSYADSPYSPQEIEQLVAPVALYPDPLLSQVLMAATYPVEVVEAARWRTDQPEKLSDRQLAQLLQDEAWDPSVKSLAAFPDILNMMNDNISWTDQLGEAFLDQQEDVMNAIQRLRVRAQAAGNLQTTSQQVVNASGNPAIITIVPAQPDLVYVPIYNAAVVYGAWPYPDYQPYSWHPPRYAAGGPSITFAGALIAGGVLWSTYDWSHRQFNVDVNRYNRFNHTRISSKRWHQAFEHRRVAADRNAVVQRRFESRQPNSRQDPSHRQSRGERQSSVRSGEAPPSRAARQPHARQQSRPADPPQSRPQSRRGLQSRTERGTPPANSRRTQGTERPAKVIRAPGGTHNNNHDRSGYGSRGGHRSEAARPPEQRQARPQEQRSRRSESFGRREKDRDK